MTLEKTNLTLSEVKENIQKKEAIGKKRTDKDLDEKERKLFAKIYPMTVNTSLAKQFAISTEDVERLAHEMGAIKDPSFTRGQKISVRQGDWKHPSAQMGTAPGYLIQEIFKTLSEEERREALTRYEEDVDPIKALKDLAFVQSMRISRGYSLEFSRDEMWRVMNDAIDSYHAILKTIYELENGQTINQNITVDDIIMERLNTKKD